MSSFKLEDPPSIWENCTIPEDVEAFYYRDAWTEVVPTVVNPRQAPTPTK